MHVNSVQGILKARYIRNSSAIFGKSGHIYVGHYLPWMQHQNVRTLENTYTCDIEVQLTLIACMEITYMLQTTDRSRTFCKEFLTLTLPGPSAGVSGSLDSYCSLKPLCSGMGEVVPARPSPTLPPSSPRTVLSLSCFKVSQCINCCDWHFKS